MAATRMRLYVLGGDEYSASVDPESLQILTYLKLVKCPNHLVDIVRTCKPWQSPTGFFPTLLVDGKTYSGSNRIIQRLKEELQESMSEDEMVDMMAFSALLKDHLRLALLYVHWLDSKNYTEVTRQWYGKMAMFPVSQFLSSRQHRLVEQEIKLHSSEDKSIEVTLTSSGEECLNMLSIRLKDKPFFNGERPSMLDAMVFGYLDIIAQYHLPGNNQLQLHLNTLKNLSCFCDRIRSIAFPEIKSRCPMRSQSSVLPNRPLWKDPSVWACLVVGGALIIVQGVRVGLFSRISDTINRRLMTDHFRIDTD